MKWQFKEDHTLGKRDIVRVGIFEINLFLGILNFSWSCYFNLILDQRQQESNKIRQKYPDRIPVIVQKVEGSQIEKIDKRKYLVSMDRYRSIFLNDKSIIEPFQVPADITAAQFMWIIRKRINLPSERAIFLFVDKMVPQSRWVNFLLILGNSV